MAQAVLKCNGMIVSRRTCCPLIAAKIEFESEKRIKDDFDTSIRDKLEDSINTWENTEIDTFDDKDLMVDEDSEFPDIVNEDPVD